MEVETEDWDRTSSTRPKPPTPRVSMMLKSVNLRLEKKAFSASCLEAEQMQMLSQNTRNNVNLFELKLKRGMRRQPFGVDAWEKKKCLMVKSTCSI